MVLCHAARAAKLPRAGITNGGVIMQTASTMRAFAGPLPTVISDRLSKKFSRNLKERAIEAGLFFAAFVSVLTTVGIVYVLLKETVVFFQHVLDLGLPDRHAMDAAVRRRPLRHHGTAFRHDNQLLVGPGRGHPLGTIIAIYLSEFATPHAGRSPSRSSSCSRAFRPIVYGYFALLFVTPILQI